MCPNPDNRIRKKIAYEAAKLLAVDGLEDFLQAKKKAANQLGINNKRMFPSNSEIESALIEYQSLFQKNEQKLRLQKMRKIACKAMALLEDYKPRLVGTALSGAVNPHSELTLHVFSDTSELVFLFLEQEGIPTKVCERRLKIEKNKSEHFTAFKFIADDIDIVLIILPTHYIKITPIDPITGQAMQRARLDEVKDLIKQN